jgi:hypothetical protein
MLDKWLWTISPKGYLDMTREQKKEISAKISATGYVYKRHEKKELAEKDAAFVKSKSGVDMNVVEVMTPSFQPF